MGTPIGVTIDPNQVWFHTERIRGFDKVNGFKCCVKELQSYIVVLHMFSSREIVDDPEVKHGSISISEQEDR